jgi:hypothetical protein
MRRYILYAAGLVAMAAIVLVLPRLVVRGWRTYSLASHQDVLPPSIEVTALVSARERTGLVREGCGGIIFQLSEPTVAAIERQGLAFFAGATQARGHSLPSDSYYRYAQWRETPVPAGWLSDGLPPSFNCMDNERAVDAAILEALKSPGSYFTTKPEAMLLVIPKREIAVFAYAG